MIASLRQVHVHGGRLPHQHQYKGEETQGADIPTPAPRCSQFNVNVYELTQSALKRHSLPQAIDPPIEANSRKRQLATAGPVAWSPSLIIHTSLDSRLALPSPVFPVPQPVNSVTMFALRRAVSARSAAATSRLVTPSLARPSARLTAAVASASRSPGAFQRRSYHETPQDTYGYRLAREFRLPDYSPEELANRQANANLLRLVHAYRTHGHLVAKLDPLGINTPKSEVPELNPARYGLVDANQTYNLNGIIHVGKSSDPTVAREQATLSTILKHLHNTYSNHIAYEFQHIPDSSERRWFSHMLESYDKRPFSAEEKKRMLALLTKSEVFDLFMTKKFPSVKRYGLEGGESMMVVMDTLFSTANAAGIVDSVDLHYPSSARPAARVAAPQLESLGGHQPGGHGQDARSANGCGEGGAEGSDCYLGDRVMCVQMHGDAAFAGQGVVAETLGLSNLPHYTCGGSVHVIVNNQVGYTTPAVNARSSRYASDVGKMINAPVIHVNGDHPEDVARATALAVEYRNKFHKDVILDLIVFRKWGHNELDEPRFTQPKMYSVIGGRPSIPRKYETELVQQGVVAPGEVEALREEHYKKLDSHLEAIDTYEPPSEHLKGKWTGMISPKEAVVAPETGVAMDTLKKVGLASVTVPEGFKVHSRLQKFHVQPRVQKIEQNKPVDWATAEALAFGSLMLDGYGVRISGQDVGRGTFSQRHCMLVDQTTENVYTPLNAMVRPGQGKLEIANSHLSEFAVVGFEFGVSWESPKTLPIWEAQFGDFFNGSQIIIDTFINSTEAKWLRQSGLVMLLPHGWDGTGPEHSSCRLERFLQLCADPTNVQNPEIPRNPNMHVVFPTTPAQYFHVLRRQMVRNFRKPLIVVGPKLILRLPAAVSELSEMGPGTSWQPVLADPAIKDPSTVERVVLVSGKFYYELAKERDAKGLTDKLQRELNKFAHVKDFVYAQEEPENQGAYFYAEPRLRQMVPEGRQLRYVGRVASAAPATGVGSVHKKEQADVIARAISL
ncbi:Transketolase, pyrimidine binding domain-domain-containing protein [Catenaria anguillulae PL171]|uniref:Transketolase, pyrimidine binding domain-domain-containing protein n=1 Tax=Catenaria anguillulae PL171 TaxID=765915 RepID=A0A1Y2H9D0_9FUNG|nr:Transketolase, pyrimidine binding domain-domain-containing protein [Catenaria anguillulae PL171]